MQNHENAAEHTKQSRRRTREEIKALIENWRSSKLSRSEFCRREVLGIQTFCNWIKRFGGTPIIKTKSPMSFIPAQTSKHHQTIESQHIEIKFPNGVQCRFPTNSDIKHIAQIAK